MVVKVLIEDGIVTGAYVDEEAEKANIDITVIDFDSNLGSDSEEMEKEIEGLTPTVYDVTHCEKEETEDE